MNFFKSWAFWMLIGCFIGFILGYFEVIEEVFIFGAITLEGDEN